MMSLFSYGKHDAKNAEQNENQLQLIKLAPNLMTL